MTAYSRAAFRDWLARLPQDEPFCDGITCPIHRAGFASSSRDAINLDPTLVAKIDSASKLPWIDITPRQVIALIDALGAE